MLPEISILVLSHNQKPLLERCLDSILKQEICVPYEIVVSDDKSTDGTKEFLNDLSNSDRVHSINNLLGLFVVHCDTNECDLSKGGRPGWNRLNAYMHARGRYFVNVDGDDFLVGTNLYQSEYEVLEAHPECTMVQTRTLKLNGDASIDEIKDCYPYSEKLKDGAIFSLEDVLCYGLRGQHQSYMYRRRPQDDMSLILGGHFDDINITYYHLQFGPEIFSDTTGYVWVQYPKSDSHRIPEDDRRVIYGLIPLRLAILFRESRDVFLRCGARKLWGTIATIPKYPQLSKGLRNHYSSSDVFIYRFYAEYHHGVCSWIRYGFIYLLLLMMKRFRLTSKFWTDMLYWGIV